jgi:arylsulfatase A-like enzyme
MGGLAGRRRFPMTSAFTFWRVRAFFAPVLLFTAALSCMRLYLYLRHGQLFIAEPSAVAWAFLRGVRFDLSAAFTVSLIFILPAALPPLLGARRLVAPALYILLGWQAILLGYQFADVHFYADTQRHLSYDLLYAWQSMGVVMKMGFTGFLPETLAMLMVIAAYGIAFRRVAIPSRSVIERDAEGTPPGWPAQAGAFILLAAVTVASARGGFQFKPLGVAHAFESSNEAMGNLSLNGVFCTYQSLWDYHRTGGTMASGPKPTQAEEDRALAWITGPTAERIDPKYPLYRRFNGGPGQARGMNVVVLIMESWTGKYLKSLGGEISGGPFFDKLAGESLLLTNCFANSQRTFEGVLAVAGSFPTWNPVITGSGGLSFQTRLRPIGSVFEAMGYHTLFFHAGEADSMGFSKLIRRLGFSSHVSLEDFVKTPQNYDGVWGIYDEPALIRANEEFEKMEKPFFAVVMSLSSHLPFKLPSAAFAKYNQFPSPKSDFLNSMGYSDFALQRFFELAKKSKYYDNTLFVITGDHTARYFSSHTMRESYLVPCLFHSPKLGLSGTLATQASQFDLIPTILDMLGSAEPFTAWGRSVFGEGPRVTTLPRDSQSRVFVADGYMLVASGEKIFGLYDMATGEKKELADGLLAEAEKLQERMRLYIGVSERMILENRVSPPEMRPAPAR